MMDDRLVNNLLHNMGPAIVGALEDKRVLEIMVNPDGKLWIERLGEEMFAVGHISSDQTAIIISLVASALDTTVTKESPIVEGELPKTYPLSGSRFEGVFPPVVEEPSFTIRKKASQVFSLEEYVETGIMTAEVMASIKAAVSQKKNIVVIGGTGSGKTTLVNAIIKSIAELTPADRLVIIEDTSELQSHSPNTIILRSSDHTSIQTLVRATMRLRPDRILVGEVRGGEALELIKSWNTGHPGGVATVHADSAAKGLQRIGDLISEASTSPMPHLIGSAVDFLIFIKRTKTGRTVSEIATVNGFNPATQQYILEYIYNEEK
ncbi:putative conjugal transfer protein trbB [Maridesulfovibrio hydrothermalis AM13 = DSM 14728]|uniref:Putative conjugal transfer protein trbB n=2 Tax=Maridesulfovibrio TaxID=2794998 RepID=L0R6F5_9BACT|nr:putative conjugal transfer protein trbB [Maridesulfovibrio hydrothermalis AM13 = DSM 14728]